MCLSPVLQARTHSNPQASAPTCSVADDKKVYSRHASMSSRRFVAPRRFSVIGPSYAVRATAGQEHFVRRVVRTGRRTGQKAMIKALSGFSLQEFTAVRVAERNGNMKSKTDVPPEPGTDDSRSTDDLHNRKDREASKSEAARGLRKQRNHDAPDASEDRQ